MEARAEYREEATQEDHGLIQSAWSQGRRMDRGWNEKVTLILGTGLERGG